MQNLQPVGTVDWSGDYGDPWVMQEEINEQMGDATIVNVLYGEDRLVYPTEDGEWIFVAELEQDADYFYDRTDEMGEGMDEFFVLDVAGEDGRFLFTVRDWTMGKDNWTKTTIRVPEQSLEQAKENLPHGGLSTAVRETINQIAQNEDRAKRLELRDELRKLRDERQEAKKEREKWDREVDDLNRKIERTEEQIEALGDPESEYKGHLDSILSTMKENGTNVFPEHGAIQEAANKGAKPPEQVIEDLKERSDLPEHRFEELGG